METLPSKRFIPWRFKGVTPTAAVGLILGAFILSTTVLTTASDRLYLSLTAGSLDPSFDYDGKVITPIGRYGDIAHSAALQSDGKIIVAGNTYDDAAQTISHIALARYNPDGSLDTSFNGTGKTRTTVGANNDRAFAVLVQNDGKIVAAGEADGSGTDEDFALVRYNPDGSLDTSFSGDGKVTTVIGNGIDQISAISLQPDGKIVAAGRSDQGASYFDIAVARYNVNGSLDLSFNGTGKQIIPYGVFDEVAGAIAIQRDGKILIAGSSDYATATFFAVVRLNTNGTLDTTFDGDGKALTVIRNMYEISDAHAIVIQPDDKIVVAGSSYLLGDSYFALVRYNKNGSLDTSFGFNGRVTHPVFSELSRVSAIGLQPDGKLVAIGYGNNGSHENDFAITRYDSNGSLDTSFGVDGIVISPILNSDDVAFGGVLQRDGKIVAVGYAVNGSYADFALARFISDDQANLRTPFDFDGDGKTDIGITRPNGGIKEWWLSRSSDSNVFSTVFGVDSDISAPGDFTGDGKTDIAVFRPSTGFWYVLRSDDLTYLAFPFGSNEDIPMPADYDGDGKADPAVFRPSTGTWYISRSSDNQTTIAQFGVSGDQPVAADYDGDGKADISIYRNNNGAEEWWIQRSSAGLFATVFGVTGDKAVPGDFTGDGKTDIAVWRPSNGNWFILRSEDLSYLAFPWGQAGDIPAPGDYDGDGKTDAAVFRPSSATWYINRTGGSGPLIANFGASTDSPVAGVFVR